MSAGSATRFSFRSRATTNFRQFGQPIEILTHLHVREDAQILYGFMTAPERDLFRLLVNHVSGIGPKLALAVLSGMNVNNFKAAVVNNDVAVAFEDQRRWEKNSGANGARAKGQGRRGRGLGSSECGACALTGTGTGERSSPGVDRARLQAGRCPQVGARSTGTRRPREIGGRIAEDGIEANGRRKVTSRKTPNVEHRTSNSEFAFGVGRSAFGVRRLVPKW